MKTSLRRDISTRKMNQGHEIIFGANLTI